MLKKGHEVRAFVRNENKASGLKEACAEIYVGNLDHPETIDGALKDIDQVYLCTWNGPTASKQGLNVINAIKKAGIWPFVVRYSALGQRFQNNQTNRPG